MENKDYHVGHRNAPSLESVFLFQLAGYEELVGGFELTRNGEIE